MEQQDAPSDAVMTQDHEIIRMWAEIRGGRPATVTSTAEDDDAGFLRIDFPGYKSAESLEPVSWQEFFAKFDEKGLSFFFQERTKDGTLSRFSKFICEGSRKSSSHAYCGRSKVGAGHR